MPMIAPSTRGCGWRQLWPLLLFLLLSGGVSLMLWCYWPQILVQSTQWQRVINKELSELLRQISENPISTGSILLGVSFGYGVVHAVGPGHGKIVIATWLATHASKLKSGLQLAFAASLLQGFVAIILVTLMLEVLQLSSHQLHAGSFWLERGSYFLAGGLGLLLSFRAISQLLRLLRRSPLHSTFASQHIDNEQRCCRHQHVPNQQQLAASHSWRTLVMVVISMGIRPCSGAVMVLLFSKVIGVFSWGVLSVLAMALGTATALSGLALLVQGYRGLAVKWSRDSMPKQWQQMSWILLALAGGVVLVVMSLAMWQSAQPVIRGLRPF